MHARYLPVVLVAALSLILFGGCAPQQVETFTPTVDSSIIGTISRVNDHVERGQSMGNLIPVTANDPLKAGDFLQVSQGGEGLLDFGNFLQLRVFNDTKLQAITLQHAENIPLYARIQLETGGFTGTLQKKEGKAVFETPNGATISILGTQFWVIYDPKTKVAGVGNFGGTISISARNTTREVTSNHYVIVKSGQPPEPERLMTLDRAGLEKLIRQQGSPLTVFGSTFEVSATPTATARTPITSTPDLTAALTQTTTPTVTPTPTQGCPPILQVIRRAVCRVNPGTSKEVMNAFSVDVTMVPSKRTFSDPVWWNVPEPASGLSCWISGENLQMTGDASCIPVVGLVPGSAMAQTATAVIMINPAALNASTSSLNGTPMPINGNGTPVPTKSVPVATLSAYP